MLQSISSVFVVYRRKTLTGSPDPTHANGTDKPCIINLHNFYCLNCIFYIAFRFSLLSKFLVSALSTSIYVIQLFNQKFICIGCDVFHTKTNNTQLLCKWKCPYLKLQWSKQNCTAQNSQSMDTVLCLVVGIVWYKWNNFSSRVVN